MDNAADIQVIPEGESQTGEEKTPGLRDTALELARYVAVGVTAMAVNVASYVVLTDFAGVYYLVANVIAWLLSFLFSFAANAGWVFGKRDSTGRRLASFSAVRLVALGLDTLVVWALVGMLGVDGAIAKVIDNVCVGTLVYLANKFIVFAR